MFASLKKKKETHLVFSISVQHALREQPAGARAKATEACENGIVVRRAVIRRHSLLAWLAVCS